MSAQGSDFEDESQEEEKPADLDISSPDPTKTTDIPIWSLKVHNKKVLKGWLDLCKHTHANAVNAYIWLSKNAMTRKPGRCFPLRYAKHTGNWCYEIGSGDRLYYKPIELAKKAVIWYAGKHPEGRIPAPPKGV